MLQHARGEKKDCGLLPCPSVPAPDAGGTTLPGYPPSGNGDDIPQSGLEKGKTEIPDAHQHHAAKAVENKQKREPSEREAKVAQVVEKAVYEVENGDGAHVDRLAHTKPAYDAPLNTAQRGQQYGGHFDAGKGMMEALNLLSASSLMAKLHSKVSGSG